MSKTPSVSRFRAIAAGAMILVSAANLLTWLTHMPSWDHFSPVAGAVLGTMLMVKCLRGRSRRAVLIVMFVVLTLGGWMTASSSGAEALAVHTGWVFVFGAGAIVRGDFSKGGGVAAKWDRMSAQAAEVSENRRAQLEYAERIERERRFQEHATRPGLMTGFEPAELAGIDISAIRPEHMYGDPGAGLAGSGFDASAVKRGAEGELNFARALVKAGLLNRYATFWSVQMPDSTLGASERFNTDIDCVVVTGTSIWLLDMKNYNQGAVTWKTEVDQDASTGKQVSHLIAVDDVTGGLVGPRRKMSLNMRLATQLFADRFQATGVALPLKPAVVLMPRPEGLGTIRDLRWAGDIPTVALPQLIGWLVSEPPFNPSHRDAPVILAILKPLLKDESGSAPRPGEIRAPSRPLSGMTVSPSAQIDTAANVIAPRQATAVRTPASPVPAPAAKSCPDCHAEVEADSPFCFECGASL